MSNLQQCKVERAERDFTILSNTIARDKELSLKAKGLLLVVFSLNEKNWDFSINGLCKIVKEGKSAVYNAIDELKEHGYCSCYQQRGMDGQLGQVEYVFYEQPNDQISENKPLSDYQQADNPYAENPTQLNTENNKTSNNKNISQKFDFRASVISLGVPQNIVDDWLSVRKTKRATNTETAFSLLAREVEKTCNLYPMATPEILVKIAVERNWMGIKCDFFRNVNFSDYIDEPVQEQKRQPQFPLFDDSGEWQG